VQLINFGGYRQFSVPKPPLLLAANRCAAYKKSQPHKQHIWFLPTQKPTLKKPKELLFTNARQKNEQNMGNRIK
jgi:hypothetical protein